MTESTETMKQRLLRESEAMVLYVSGRGLQKDLPTDGSLDVLDGKIDIVATPLSKLLRLHQTLSRMVAPALPETLALLQYHQEMSDRPRQGWRRIAPLSSIIFLIFFTIALALLLGALVVTKNWPAVSFMQMNQALAFLQGECRSPVLFQEAVNKLLVGISSVSPADVTTAELQTRAVCQNQRGDAIFGLYLFFGMIGALGATYSSIYDSFAFIRDGTYDIRLASTYYVRIFLGAFSGILLAEPLSEYLDSGAFSSTLLAFMGGFAAQLVYDILTKIVDSIANMFRPERRKERMDIHEKAVLNAREAILEDDAARRAELADVIQTAQTIKDPTKRAQTLQRAVIGLMSKSSGALDDLRDDLHAHPSAGGLGRMVSLFQLGERLLPLLPGDVNPTLEFDVKRTVSALVSARDDSGGTSPADTDAVLSHAEQSDPVTPLVNRSLTALETVFDPAQANAIAKSATIASHMFDDAQLLRWRVAAYDATPATPLLLIADADATALMAAAPDPIADAMRQALNQSGSIDTLRTALASGTADNLFDALHGQSLDRATFDQAMPGWVSALSAQLFANDLDTIVGPMTGQTMPGSDIARLVHKIPGNDTATAALQQLELIGGCVSACDTPKQVLDDLLATIDAQSEQGDM